jgi:hypothetical protein
MSLSFLYIQSKLLLVLMSKLMSLPTNSERQTEKKNIILYFVGLGLWDINYPDSRTLSSRTRIICLFDFSYFFFLAISIFQIINLLMPKCFLTNNYPKWKLMAINSPEFTPTKKSLQINSSTKLSLTRGP